MQVATKGGKKDPGGQADGGADGARRKAPSAAGKKVKAVSRTVVVKRKAAAKKEAGGDGAAGDARGTRMRPRGSDGEPDAVVRLRKVDGEPDAGAEAGIKEDTPDTGAQGGDRPASMIPAILSNVYFWLAVAGTIILVLALGVILAPEIFWENFLYKYYISPIVADSTGSPGNEYNPVDTTTYGILLAVSVFLIYRLLKRWNVNMSGGFFLAVLPFILLGGFSRVMEDSELFNPPFSYWFITPGMWILTGLGTIAALTCAVGVNHINRTKGHLPATVFLAAVLAVFFCLHLTIVEAAPGWFNHHVPHSFVGGAVLAVFLGLFYYSIRIGPLQREAEGRGDGGPGGTVKAGGGEAVDGDVGDSNGAAGEEEAAQRKEIEKKVVGKEKVDAKVMGKKKANTVVVGKKEVDAKLVEKKKAPTGVVVKKTARLVVGGTGAAHRRRDSGGADGSGPAGGEDPKAGGGYYSRNAVFFGLGAMALSLPVYLVIYWHSVEPWTAKLEAGHQTHWAVFPMSILLALGVTGLTVGIFRLLAGRFKALTAFATVTSAILFFSHYLDASATYIGIDFFDYAEMHVLPNFLIGLTGSAWVMFPLKFVVVALILYFLDISFKDEMAKRPQLFGMVKLCIAILGLAPGIRDALRTAMGV